jgi:Protein of unknown function (DUF2934)
MVTATKQLMIVPPTESPAIKTEPTLEKVRQRAYELYLFRGDRPGDALDDWLEAERELRAKSA